MSVNNKMLVLGTTKC